MSHVQTTLLDAAPLPFPALLEAFVALGVTFTRKGDSLSLRDGGGVLTMELKEAAREHKADLLTLCDVRAEFTRLHDYIVRLRCEDLPKTPRPKALDYLTRQVDALAARCDVLDTDGQEVGYDDPSDPFAADALDVLRGELREVEAGPYPLGPLGADPFAEGRLLNGKQSR